MSKITIYGASDDLIEVDGKVAGCDEFNGDRGVVVCEPTGDRFLVRYGGNERAVWDIDHEHASGRLTVAIAKAPPGDDPEPYTDTATVSGDIQRVCFWETWPPTAEETRTRVERAIEAGLSDEEIAKVWEALGSP